MKQTITYLHTLSITPREYPRVFGGLISQADFDTTKPNPKNIAKISIGLEQYLRQKRTNMEE